MSFAEFRDFFMLLPTHNTEAVFEYWARGSTLDIGEDFAVPDDKEKHTGRSAAITFAAGAVAGAISRTATAPMDRLKVLLQANAGGGGGGAGGKGGGGGGIGAGLRAIYGEGGWRAFYRGNGTNVLKICPESGIKFFAFDFFKRALAREPAAPTPAERFAAGSLAGALAQFAIYPLEITKTRLAVSAPGEYAGILDCVTAIARKEGFAAVYAGLGTSTAGIIPYAGTDLAVYSFLKDEYARRHPDTEPPISALLGCGAASSTAGQLVAYPMQLVRTRMQAQGIPGMPTYAGPIACARATVAAEGVRGLYRGLLPNFLKTLPAISISYAVFEWTKRNLAVRWGDDGDD